MISWRDKSSRHHHSEDGFTLTEILITVVILGILAAIAVPIYNSQRSKTDDATLKANMMSSMNNIMQAKTAFGGLFPSTIAPQGKPAIIASTVDGLVFNYTVPYDRQNFCLQGTYKGDTVFITADKKLSTSDCTYTYVVPAPANFSAQVNLTFKPTARWDTVDGATTYNVYKDGVKILSTSANNATLAAMTPGSTALYWVRGVINGTETDDSNKVSLTAPVPAPATAPILSYTQTSENGPAMTTANTISWTAVQWATSYTLYDADTNTLVFSGSGTSFNVTIAKQDTNRYYVIASNDTGNSPKSNIITIAPKFVTPLLTASQDEFNLKGTYSWQAMAANFGTGAKAVVMTSAGGSASTATTANTLTRTDLTRANSSWKVRITTGNGVVLDSNVVSFSPTAIPAVAVTYNPYSQKLNYAMTNTPADYGMTSANSKWVVEVSDTTSFSKTYPQSNTTGTAPSVATDDEIQPTHGGTYYVRYKVIRNSDSATITSATKSINLPTKSLDRLNDGSREVPVVNTSLAGYPISWSSLWSGGNMDTIGSYKDPRNMGSAGCQLNVILDFSGPGSQGLLCFYPTSGNLYYFDLADNGSLGAAKLVGTGWDMYSEIAVVQNWWGDDLPAILAVTSSSSNLGQLQAWHTNGQEYINNVDRETGNGWAPSQPARIFSVSGIYDYNGYGTVGLATSTKVAPWLRVYPSKQLNTTGAANFGTTMSWEATWNKVIGSNANFPVTGRPGTMSSYAYARDWASTVVNDKVVPVLAFGPVNYTDFIKGNGANGLESLHLNIGWSNNYGVTYPGQ